MEKKELKKYGRQLIDTKNNISKISEQSITQPNEVSILVSGNEFIALQESLFVEEILRIIKSAKSEIKIVSYLITDDMVITHVQSKLKNNMIKVFIVVDYEGIKENKDLEKNLKRLKKEFPDRFNYKIFKDRGRRLHAKFIVIDREKAVVGSQNITFSALHSNLELAIYLKGEIVEKLNQIFDILWEEIT